MNANTKPLARSDELVVEEFGDELLVYDLRTDRAHNLGPEAAKVWRRCDGRTSVDALRAELDLDSEMVNRALDELAGCELLDSAPELVQGSTRREISVKLAKAGAAVAAAPLILSVSPAPAHAQATLEFCLQFTSQNCGGGNNGCKSEVGCCCCTPAGGSTGCPNAPPQGNGAKYCVPLGANAVATCQMLCNAPTGTNTTCT